jgi:hypothetical protein
MVSRSQVCVGKPVAPFCRQLLTFHSHGKASETIREHTRHYSLQLTKASGSVKNELERILSKAKEGSETAESGRFGHDDLLERLNGMSLDQLSAHVSVQMSRLQNAQDGLESRRARGPHKASAKVQKFVLEFDRFLNAYSGIMSIVTLVDGQYGSVASATLSLLFAVSKKMAIAESG